MQCMHRWTKLGTHMFYFFVVPSLPFRQEILLVASPLEDNALGRTDVASQLTNCCLSSWSSSPTMCAQKVSQPPSFKVWVPNCKKIMRFVAHVWNIAATLIKILYKSVSKFKCGIHANRCTGVWWCLHLLSNLWYYTDSWIFLSVPTKFKINNLDYTTHDFEKRAVR